MNHDFSSDLSPLTRVSGHGLLLGKFMPLHQGHMHLIRFAREICNQVTVVVDCVEGEWPSAEERAEILRKEVRGLNIHIVALKEPTPQDPSAHPDFWNFWRNTLIQAAGVPDTLVCSMDYGRVLSEQLGCDFLPLDIMRTAIPFSATMAREDPWGTWDRIMPYARVPYLARVALEGPESTGKSTIAMAAAQRYGFTYAPEWASDLIAQRATQNRSVAEESMLLIARGQVAMERSLELQANRALISDSSLLTTAVWSQHMYGRVDPEINRLLDIEEARAPRMRWLFTPETPWVLDHHRNVLADGAALSTRWRFWDRFVQGCEERGFPYEIISGDFAQKQDHVLALAGDLHPNGPPSNDLESPDSRLLKR